MKFTYQSIIRKLWYLIATVIIFMAVMVTLARALTPLINHHKAGFERWASQVLGVPVKVERLAAWWDGFRPDIRLLNVRIKNRAGTETRLHVQELRIDVSIWQSLLHWRIQPDEIEISGASLVVHQAADRTIKIEGLQTQAINLTGNSDASFNNHTLTDWIASQRYLLFRNLHIDYYSPRGEKHIINMPELLVLNSGSKHFVSGRIFLVDQQQRSVVKFSSIITGGLASLQTDDFQLYLLFNNFQLSDLPIRPVLAGMKLEKGLFDGQVWATLQDFKLNSLQTLFELRSARLTGGNGEKPLVINHAAGNVFWQQKSGGFELSGDHITIQTPDKRWPENQFMLQLFTHPNGEKMQRLWVRFLNIADVDKFILAGYFHIPDKLRALSHQFNLHGALSNFYLSHHQKGDQTTALHVAARFNKLGFNRLKPYPGVQNISGDLDFTKDRGVLHLNSQSVSLDFGSLFIQSLVANLLQGDVNWHRDLDGRWVVRANNLVALNKNMAMVGSAGLLIPKGKTPIISLLAGYHLNDSSVVKYYLPVGILPHKGVVDWLNQAFVAGEGALGHVILRGPINAFPFDHHEGTFLVDGDVKNTTFHYGAGWPDVKKLNAELEFRGRSMSCHATAGETTGIGLNYFNAKIPIMGGDDPNVLLLNGGVTTDAGRLLNFLGQTPLKQQVQPILDQLILHGKSDLTLTINVPLADPDDTNVQGKVDLTDGTLSLPQWQLLGDQLNGILSFDNQNFSSDALSMRLFGLPFTAQVKTISLAKKQPATQVNFHGQLPVEKTLQQFNEKQLDDLHGQIDYQGYLNLPHDVKTQNQLHLTSSLQGLTIDIPLPFQKSAADIWPSTLDFWFGQHLDSKLQLAIQNHLASKFLFTHTRQGVAIKHGDIAIGSNESLVKSPESGIAIQASLPSLDLDAWQHYYDQKTKAAEFSSSSLLSFVKRELKKITLTLQQFSLLQQEMNPVTFILQPEANGVQTSINSLRIAGSLFVPYSYPDGIITGHFTKLYLQAFKQLDNEGISPDLVPSLNISADNLQYGDRYFGAVSLETQHQPNQLLLRHLKMNSPILTGSASGAWFKTKTGKEQSQLSGNIASSNVDQLLQTFNFKSSLRVKKGKGIFNLRWPGAIYRPTLASLAGSLSLNFGEGRIIDLGNQASTQLNLGRLVTLLSVNRLIHLDFSDFTQKGFNFDSMAGDFIFDHGFLTTKDLALAGSVADIAIKGNINLLKENVDLLLAIMPHVTASLPIIAAVVINPLAGAVAWAADKVFNKTIGKRVIVHRYRVTGNWKKPKIVKL